MRPDYLTPLFASVEDLTGVGPRVAQQLQRLMALPGGAMPRVLDLLWHLPNAVVDRRAEPAIADAAAGTIVTLKVRVLRHKSPGRGSKAPFTVHAEDDSGALDIVYFHGDPRYLAPLYPVGETIIVSGRVERYGERLQMLHPDYALKLAELAKLPRLEPIYPLTAGLSAKMLARFINQAVDRVPAFAEWQDQATLEKHASPDFATALRRLHRPEAPSDIGTTDPARQRLAYDELLAGQLALALVRRAAKSVAGRAIIGNGTVRQRLTAALPFALTKSQLAALAEIESDLAKGSRMLRLLQGDVGSGKTVVALMSAAIAIEAGLQTAIMAPTEVLARQHAETMAPLCAAAGIRLGLLTGREKGKSRSLLLERLEEGGIDVLVGTHALFQDDVFYKDLGLAVIDEQHRFGVQQRLALQAKGGPMGANVLFMTATPIPRTLLMTHYGDLDVSKLVEKPAGRKPIKTVAMATERMEDLLDGLRRALTQGAQIYWVCPLVESGATTELAAAQARAAHLRQVFGPVVGLVHGQMKGADKDAVMADFSADRLKILVATTVIEVGVNVPNASIMVIEHAERFGLAQLHQLRGRVGRGERQSSCVLLYQSPLGEIARARLETMKDTEDGFVIAEKDLQLRGGGELLGTRQSGAPAYRVAEVPNFAELVETARADATLALQRDPDLVSSRGRALRDLLYLFDCDEAVRLFRSG